MTRNAATWIGGSVAGLAVLLLLLMTPFALAGLATVNGVDWASLADVGEAYGSAVALLTAVSLLVLAISAAFQVRAARISSETTTRVLHYDIMRLVMEDPSLAQVEGLTWDGTAESSEEIRRWVYANIQLAHFRSLYVLKELPEAELRLQMAGRFRSRTGRHHWKTNRTWYRASARHRRDQRFCDVVEEEYQKALQAGEATAERSHVARRLSRELVAGGIAALAIIGAKALLDTKLGRRS
ncbi:DUF6082 family protein [Nonomuraea sp. NPDC049421]|uniref:DUF6082 family protein n=1 Tax=Nonomuraea sp. NPDC049421 TaxID=3155275 RepID=UPI00344A37BC